MNGMQEVGAPPYKVMTPLGGVYQGIDTITGAIKKADEKVGSLIVDSDGAVIYTSKAKPE